MKMITVFLLLLTAQTFAADYSYFEDLLQAKLGFSGQVEVTQVTPQSNGDFVVMEVRSYGEVRENWCLIEEGKVLQCMDNWFYKQ